MDDNSFNINITNETKKDGRSALSKQISDIKDARKAVLEQNSILNQDLNSLANDEARKKLQQEMNNLSQTVRELNNVVKESVKSGNEQVKANATNIKSLMAAVDINKEVTDAYRTFYKAQEDYKRAVEEGTMTWEQAFDLDEAFTKLQQTIPTLTKVVDGMKKSVENYDNAVEESTKQLIRNNKYREGEIKDTFNKDREKHKENIKTGGQSLPKAYHEEITKLGNTIRDVTNAININKLASQLAPTSRQKIQQDLQTNYNLSGSEFESFKKDLYGQIDKSLYTDEEIKAAMQTLNTTALGSSKTATQYFSDIIKGQKVLGMSMETQQNLLKLGNITGRNELTFYQNQVAKYLNSSLGLNKKQLDELVNMNASLSMQAADIGIATEAFSNTSLNEMAAFEATNTGAGALYNHVMQRALSDETFANNVLGMSVGELSARQARGESLISMLRNTQSGSAKAMMNVLASGDINAIRSNKQYAAQALGIDDQTWSLLRILVQQQTELNNNLSTATAASQDDAMEAMKSLEEKEFDAITGIQKVVNYMQNTFEENVPWQILNELGNISILLTTLIGAVSVGGSLKELFGGSKGGILGKLAGSKAGGKFLTMGSGGKVALTSLGTKLIGAGGIAVAGYDALNMYSQTGNPLDLARGALMGSGHKDQTDGQKFGSIAGNALKGAAIGAMVGHPVIGAVIGGALGWFGTLFSKQSEKEETAEEKRARKNEEYFEAIKQNTYNTAINTAKNGIGIVYRYRSSNSMAGTGGTGIGDEAGLKYNVSSHYGPREPLVTKNGHITSKFHSGTDFAAPEGAPLFSNVTGTVLATGQDSAGANYVGVTDDRTGYTHWYWHMMKPATVREGQHIAQGTLVGYVGQTGNATGPHLHYTVTKPGRNDWWNAESTVDSLPFATNSIFEGGNMNPGSLMDVTPGATSEVAVTRTARLSSKNIGDVAPIVNSITDLKNTIISLSEQTSRNQKIMDALVNRTMQSPTV